MNQFLKTYRELYKQGCKPNQVAILTAIFDRMESSRQRTNFYSDTYHDYFVIYTYEELANFTNLSISSIRRIIESCVASGYLTIHHINKRVNGIFMTNKSKAIANFDDNAVPTQNNVNVQNEKRVVQNEQLIKLNNYTKINITDNITKDLEIKNLENALITKVGLNKLVVKGLSHLVKHDSKQLHHVISMLLKAKKHVARELQHEIKFEDIDELLIKNVYNIVKHALKTNNADAYMYVSFVKMLQPQKKTVTKTIKHNCDSPSWLHTTFEDRKAQYSDDEIQQAENKVNELLARMK